MDRVRRSGVRAPGDWKRKVDAALQPNAAAFWKEAKAFEKLLIDDKQRREGFAAFAPLVLPVAKGKKRAGFPDVWRSDKRVKAAIKKMSRGRCAYCQSNVDSNQPGHVEHFKPKTLFPTFAYLWVNYFLGCEACNRHKGGKWPKAHEGEYVRPDQPSPGRRFVFESNGRVRAKVGDLEAELTCRDLKLDRPGLRKHRREHIKLQLRFLRKALAQGRPMSRAEMEEYLVPALSLFSEAVNQSVQRVWGQRGRRRSKSDRAISFQQHLGDCARISGW